MNSGTTDKNQNDVREVIVLGSGPAGLTAAIYTARATLKPLVIAGPSYGGQLMTTTLVENYPGFPEGIMGPKLMMDMVQHAKNQGAEMIYELATKVDFSGDIKKVYVGDKVFQAKAVIITVGSKANTLGIPGEQDYWARGVHTCATCDGAFYKGKKVAVIGGGDSAMEEASFLSRFAEKVYVVHRREEFRASKIMQERVMANEKIEVIWNTEVKEVIGDEKHATGLKLFNTKENKDSELEMNGMFLAIGHSPNTQFLEGELELDDKGYIVLKENTMASVDGVFAAGEIVDLRYKQAISSAGDGCKAAIDAERWLERA